MILIIDNYDSFTYNLVQQVESLGVETMVVANDGITIDEISVLKPEKIIISPGPRTPDYSGICQQVIQEFHKEIPILGVCLGHQCLGQVFGSKIVSAKEIRHGKTSLVSHNGKGLFSNIPNPFIAARYHSLVIDRVPDEFELSAWTDDQEIMAIQHKTYPVFGIQFHPESFMTPDGALLLQNFLHVH